MDEPFFPTDVYSILRSFIGILHANAWVHMGFVANPQTNKIEKDLSQAKIAIDCISFMIDQIKERLDEKERRNLQTLIADLQINFAKQSEKKE